MSGIAVVRVLWRRPARAAVVAVAFLACGRLSAQTVPPLELVAHRTPTSIVLSAAPRQGKDAQERRAELADALSRGYRSQIVLQIRVYERTHGLAGLLGDRLEHETVLTRGIRREGIAGGYIMEETIDGSSARVVAADTPQELLELFFAVTGLVLPVRRPGTGSLYVRARYLLSPIHVSPELSLVALFAGRGARDSRWSVAEDLGP